MRFPISDIIVTDILSRTVSELSQLIVQISDTAFLTRSSPLWGLRENVRYWSWAHWKARSGLRFVLTEVFFTIGVPAESLRAKIDRKPAISLQRGHFWYWSKISSRRGPPTNHFARL